MEQLEVVGITEAAADNEEAMAEPREQYHKQKEQSQRVTFWMASLSSDIVVVVVLVVVIGSLLWFLCCLLFVGCCSRWMSLGGDVVR